MQEKVHESKFVLRRLLERFQVSFLKHYKFVWLVTNEEFIFSRTSYNEHTKCVTELERYSAKGFVPKPSSNKGERKQQSWLEVIQAVLKKPNLGKQQRSLLESLSGVSNVPRKKPKFRVG